MISYQEACNQVGYNKDDAGPGRQIKYYAYRRGEVTIFDDRVSANRHSVTVERVVLNQEEYDAWANNQKELNIKAKEVWLAALKEEYLISEAVFNLIYAKACDDACGYDDVADKFEELYEFAIECGKHHL